MDSFLRLQTTIARFLGRYESLGAERPVLAAVSGGVDSSVLLLALARLGAEGRLPGPLHVAHIDHACRPDSRAMAQHVVDRCDRLDLPVHVRRLPEPTGRPSEATLRQGRYEALQAIGRELGAGLLVTGHHADDNLETVLFRLLRGTGPRGLAGIPEARWIGHGDHRMLLVRPLLRTRRATLENLLQQLGETAVEDPSNQDQAYARNELRLATLPRLRQQLGIGLDVSLMTLASTAKAASEILEAQGLRLLAQRSQQPVPWRQALDLRGLPDDARPFVSEALRQAHVGLHRTGAAPSTDWLERVLALLDKPAGKRVAGRGGLLVERTRDGLLLVDQDRAGAPPRTEDGGQLLRLDCGRQRFGATEWLVEAHSHPLPPLVPSPAEAGRFRALLEPKHAPGPWRLRTRRPGDQFQPLGYPAAIELRRFLQGRHLARFDRDRLPLLVDGRDRVLWVPGVEIGEAARLQLQTRHCVEVRVVAG